MIFYIKITCSVHLQALWCTQFRHLPLFELQGYFSGSSGGWLDENGNSPPFAIAKSFVPVFLTHWGRATHICVGKLTTIGSDNGLSPGRRQAIIWTNAGILLIWPLGTNFSEILIEINIFSFKKMHLKMSSGKWRPSCLGLNVLILRIWSSAMTWKRSPHYWPFVRGVLSQMDSTRKGKPVVLWYSYIVEFLLSSDILVLMWHHYKAHVHSV